MMMILMDIIIPAHGSQLDDALGSHHESIPAVVLLVMYVNHILFISPSKAQRSNSGIGTGKLHFRQYYKGIKKDCVQNQSSHDISTCNGAICASVNCRIHQ